MTRCDDPTCWPIPHSRDDHTPTPTDERDAHGYRYVYDASCPNCRAGTLHAVPGVRADPEDGHDIRCVDCGQTVGPGMVACLTPGAGLYDDRPIDKVTTPDGTVYRPDTWRDLAHAFRTYAQHSPGCAYQPTYPDTATLSCDCAFDVLLDRYDRLGAE